MHDVQRQLHSGATPSCGVLRCRRDEADRSETDRSTRKASSITRLIATRTCCWRCSRIRKHGAASSFRPTDRLDQLLPWNACGVTRNISNCWDSARSLISSRLRTSFTGNRRAQNIRITATIKTRNFANKSAFATFYGSINTDLPSTGRPWKTARCAWFRGHLLGYLGLSEDQTLMTGRPGRDLVRVGLNRPRS